LVKERSLEPHRIRQDVFVLLQLEIDDLLGVVAVQSPGFECRHDASDLGLVANECLIFTGADEAVNLVVILLLAQVYREEELHFHVLLPLAFGDFQDHFDVPLLLPLFGPGLQCVESCKHVLHFDNDQTDIRRRFTLIQIAFR